MTKYKVTLTAEERQQLSALIATGKAAARKLAHARVLLHADAADGAPAWTDDRIGNNGIYAQNVNQNCSLGNDVTEWDSQQAVP